MTGRKALAGTLALVAGLAVSASTASAAELDPAATVITGDADIAAVTLVAGALAVRAGDGAAPADLVLRAEPAPDGTAAWQVPGLAWDTSGVPAGQLAGDLVRWRLTTVEGPGQVVITEPDAEPPLFDSRDGLPDQRDLPVGARGETTWTFDTPGRHLLRFALDADLGTGEPASTEATYLVDVPTVEPSPTAAPIPTTAEPEATPHVAPPAVQLRPQGAQLDRKPRAARVLAPNKQVSAAKAAGGSATVLAQGHADVAARPVGTGLQIQIKDGTKGGTPVWREPSTVVFHARPAGKIEVPDDPAFAFLGKAGDPLWTLPQVQDSALLWPGWNTEEWAAGTLAGDLTWRLVGVDGPGAFALFASGSFGEPDIHFNSRDGLPDALSVPRGTHAHGNWAFAKEGVYRLTFEMSGKRSSGETISDRETLAIAVGSTDPTTVRPGTGTGNGGKPSASASGSASPRANGGGSLPRTGSGMVVTAAVLGGGLLAGGAVLVLVARRRRGPA